MAVLSCVGGHHMPPRLRQARGPAPLMAVESACVYRLGLPCHSPPPRRSQSPAASEDLLTCMSGCWPFASDTSGDTWWEGGGGLQASTMAASTGHVHCFGWKRLRVPWSMLQLPGTSCCVLCCCGSGQGRHRTQAGRVLAPRPASCNQPCVCGVCHQTKLHPCGVCNLQPLAVVGSGWCQLGASLGSLGGEYKNCVWGWPLLLATVVSRLKCCSITSHGSKCLCKQGLCTAP